MLSIFQQVNLEFPWFFTGVFFVLGAIVGSFLNVCIYRIPGGESVVSPGSRCACGKPIPLWLNIPVLAWFFLRGRATCCGRKISFRYPAVEFLTALAFSAAWYFLPWDIAVPAMIFSAFSIVLGFIDWDTMFLPDSVNAPFVIAGLICSAAFPAMLGAENVFSGLFSGIVGLGVGSMAAYWFRYFASLIFRREAMGEGDVILLGGIGAFLGWEGALFSFFFSSFIGLFAVLLSRIFSRKCREELEPSNGDGGDEESGSSPFPLGPWLLIAAAVYFVFGKKLIALYFSVLAM